MDDVTKIILGFIGSIILTLFGFFLNWWNERRLRKKERKKQLANEIFNLCERILRYAIHCSQLSLTAKYYFALYQIDKHDFDASNYATHFKDAEASRLKIVELITELSSKINDLYEYWGNTDEIQAIENELKAECLEIIKTHNGLFNEGMTKELIERIYLVESKKIADYVFKESCGKHLLIVQKIVCPRVNIPRQ